MAAQAPAGARRIRPVKQLILHIGTEKTGTTSLQADLYANRDALAAQGVGLLSAADTPNNRRIASYARMRPAHEFYDLQLARTGENWREVLQQAVRAEIQAMPASMHSVIVTSEHLQSRLNTVEEVQRVADLFAGLFEQVKVIVYLRRQDRLATSLYSTALRGGWAYDTPFTDGAPVTQDLYYNYAELLKRWAQVFGAANINVRLFEPKKFVGGQLHSDFCHACGLPEVAAHMKLGPARNEALPAVVATAVLAFNRAMAGQGVLKEDPQAVLLRERIISNLSPRFAGPPPAVAKKPAQRFLAKFSASNQAVARQWFGREQLFDDDFSSYSEQPCEPQLPLAALETVNNILLQARRSNQVPTGAHAADLFQLLRQLSAVPVRVPDPAVLARLAQALQKQLPTLAQRLNAISQQLRGKA